jgi:hypothetical protein
MLERLFDKLKPALALLSVYVPWLERQFRVLPVADAVRDSAMPAAVLATVLCVVAGYATARHSYQGMQIGWTALMLFLAVMVAMFGFMDLIPRGERGLYILCFALFGLSVSSFLSIPPPGPPGPEPSMVRW